MSNFKYIDKALPYYINKKYKIIQLENLEKYYKLQLINSPYKILKKLKNYLPPYKIKFGLIIFKIIETQEFNIFDITNKHILNRYISFLNIINKLIYPNILYPDIGNKKNINISKSDNFKIIDIKQIVKLTPDRCKRLKNYLIIAELFVEKILILYKMNILYLYEIKSDKIIKLNINLDKVINLKFITKLLRK